MKCPFCKCPDAKYAPFSGGREGHCPDCDDNFSLSALPEDEQPRATLLQTEAGRIALRAQMDQELARRREEEL